MQLRLDAPIYYIYLRFTHNRGVLSSAIVMYEVAFGVTYFDCVVYDNVS